MAAVVWPIEAGLGLDVPIGNLRETAPVGW